MCDCDKKEIDPQPGEVWDMLDGRKVLLAAISKSKWPYKAIILEDDMYESYEKKDFIHISENQSHDVILPNVAPPTFKLEVGKVYENQNGDRFLCFKYFNDNSARPFSLMQLNGTSAGWRYEYTPDGYYNENLREYPYMPVKLSPNQSREIIL